MNVKANSLILDKKCLEMARKQFCLDIGLSWEEYVKNSKKAVFIQKSVYAPNTLDIANSGARNYAGRTSFFRAIICLGQLFICCDESIYDWVVEQYGQCKPEWFCEFGSLRKLEEKLQEHEHRIYDTHVYFLPEAECMQGEGESRIGETHRNKTTDTNQVMQNEGHQTGSSGKSEYVWFDRDEISHFKENNHFTSALSFWKGHPDILAVAQMKNGYAAMPKDYDQNHMAGMVGASLDGEYLWQIGINVDKEYAGCGLGHNLVRTLKEEILQRGKVPFYGTSESHTVSQTVGLKAGFVPAWTEVSVERIK